MHQATTITAPNVYGSDLPDSYLPVLELGTTSMNILSAVDFTHFVMNSKDVKLMQRGSSI
ncbi:CLUMA_CG009546, isoform A [Clunio marinus]|uniref:CLUMA_CG009546, isoform A n=1 Tax=Clunio marinus TaxID=568069 RepID=A0A1J1I726_9DIPT|nr:CLUMA_CG009546, isoform A [Clunio marinus]